MCGSGIRLYKFYIISSDIDPADQAEFLGLVEQQTRDSIYEVAAEFSDWDPADAAANFYEASEFQGRPGGETLRYGSHWLLTPFDIVTGFTKNMYREFMVLQGTK